MEKLDGAVLCTVTSSRAKNSYLSQAMPSWSRSSSDR